MGNFWESSTKRERDRDKERERDRNREREREWGYMLANGIPWVKETWKCTIKHTINAVNAVV